MTDFHVRQFDGPPHTCDGRNCAAASCAMAIAFATDGHPLLSADDVRKESGVSCVPGVHSASGGLYISDVERVCAAHGVAIDYGRTNGGDPRRWTPADGLERLASEFGVILGDYDQLGKYAASTFKGDHSAGAHDYRASDDSVCWHDPLRTKPIRLPVRVFLAYWQKPGSPVRGLAGFVTEGGDMAEDTINVAGVGVTSTGRATVKNGTKWYRDGELKTEGGTITGDHVLPWIGAAKGGGRAIVYRTAKPYGDGVLRDTIVYVRSEDAPTSQAPAPDCADEIAAAVAADRRKAKIVYS